MAKKNQLVKKENKILPIKSLEETTGNPQRMNHLEYEGLKKSIKQKGFILDDIVVWQYQPGKYRIISGHHRARAAADVGLTELNCKVLTGLTEQQARLLVLEANQRRGDFNEVMLDDYIDTIISEFNLTKDFIYDDIGVIDFDLRDVDVDEDDFDIDKAVEEHKAVAKTGDLWQLGKHRILCGDAIVRENVERLMGGEKATMVFTDPPYNVAYGTSKKHPSWRTREIEGDKQNLSDWISFNEKLAAIFKEFCKGDLYMWGASGYGGMKARCIMIEAGLHWSATIVWKKNRMVLTPAKYQRMYEPCLYGWFNKSSFRGNRKNVEVWEYDRPTKSDLHPTMKPIKLCANAISLSSSINDSVLDLFLGSGSTLIAAEQTNRVCYGMEIDPLYIDVTITRWEEYTGRKAKLIKE